jgi:hypothetical protein
MSSLKSFVIASFVATVMFPRASSAMDIGMYDDMARQDQRNYLTFLVKATQKVLTDEGRPDLSSKVHELFQGRGGDRRSPGEVQFEEVLAKMRAYSAENSRPVLTPGPVEGAFIQTLVRHGIQMPNEFVRSLAQVVREKPFWPKRPLSIGSSRTTSTPASR